MIMPEEADKNYENRKNHEEKITVEKLEKFERQKQVYLQDLQGYKNKEIAETMGVSLSTIEKDLHEIRQQAKTWFLELTKSGLAKSLADAVSQIDLVQKELWKLYRVSGINVTKTKILNSIADNSVKKKELFWAKQEPYYHGFGKD